MECKYNNYIFINEPCHLVAKNGISVALTKRVNTLKRLPATICILLYRRAFYRTVTAKHTAIACFWLQSCFTVYTFIKKLAGVCGHRFFLLMQANRAGNR